MPASSTCPARAPTRSTSSTAPTRRSAPAPCDLSRQLSWEQAYPLFLITIPDLAAEPRFHDIFETAHLQLLLNLGPEYHAGRRHTNQGTMSVREAEEYIDVM